MDKEINAQDTTVGGLVNKARRIMITSRLIIGVLIWMVICAGLWLVLFWLDNVLHFPAGLRLALTVSGVGLMIFSFWKNLYAALFRRQGLGATALLLESEYSVSENFLINAFQFESARLSRESAPFARKTIHTGLAEMAKASFGDLWRMKKITRYAVAVLLILLLWATYALSQGHLVGNAFARFARPLADIPPAGSGRLKVTPDRDITITERDDVKISVEVLGGGEGASASYPTIAWADDSRFMSNQIAGGKNATMRPAEQTEQTFSHTFRAVRRSFAFRVFAGDTYSRSIKVTVNTLPQITESQFGIKPPAYTGLDTIQTMGPPRPLFGLPEAAVDVRIKLDKPVEEMWFEVNDESIAFEEKDGLWTAGMKIKQAGPYRVEVKKSGVEKRLLLAEGSVSVEQDASPQVEFVTDSANMTVDPGMRLAIDVQATDDYGLGGIYVTVQESPASGEPIRLKEWKFKGPPGKDGLVKETLLLSVDSDKFKPGSSYVLQAFCTDFGPAGHVGKSDPLVLRVRSLEELTIADDDPAGSAFEELDKAIAAQQAALSVSKNLSANIEDVFAADGTKTKIAQSLKNHQDRLKDKQQRVGKHLTNAWDVSPEPRPSFVEKMVAIRDGAHRQLTAKMNDGVFGGRVGMSGVASHLRSVENLQAHILEQLIALKSVVAAASRSEAEKEAADILGEEEEMYEMTTEEILEKTARELDEFAKAQKKIMEERTMLMDLPPEDFSDEQDEAFDKLAIDQSKIAEILSDAINDFTNLDLQDFGDNAMVDQMTAIFEKAEELDAAAMEAAANRMARQDAYRLETEAVEMAEEIMINCEATLGFNDSIQFIAEIAEDEQLVAPLAELPSELEDLVGDLITTEEEMQPEVEDIGSYLNSLDHTAGPVADGTISSTSAKGKTGDQKPEDNVIQGRSGAGRSGMSDGQLVESVAKQLEDNEYGLRERLSNTAFESGQVKDEDTGAQTGGTGMGKTTDGSSAFGVGGKLPPKVLEMMRDAESKQQNTRQAAEQIVTKLRQHNLPTEALEYSVDRMKGVEEALQNRDGVGIRKAYSEAVNSLKKSKYDINRKIAIRYVNSSTSTRQLDNMLTEDQQTDFEGYERIISAYFEALAKNKDKKIATEDK